MALDNDEVARLDEIIAAVQECKLFGWNKTFFDDVCKQYDEKGADLYLSKKQWENLERLYANA